MGKKEQTGPSMYHGRSSILHARKESEAHTLSTTVHMSRNYFLVWRAIKSSVSVLTLYFIVLVYCDYLFADLVKVEGFAAGRWAIVRVDFFSSKFEKAARDFAR